MISLRGQITWWQVGRLDFSFVLFASNIFRIRVKSLTIGFTYYNYVHEMKWWNDLLICYFNCYFGSQFVDLNIDFTSSLAQKQKLLWTYVKVVALHCHIVWPSNVPTLANTTSSTRYRSELDIDILNQIRSIWDEKCIVIA